MLDLKKFSHPELLENTQLFDSDNSVTFQLHAICAAAVQSYESIEDYHCMLGNLLSSFEALGHHWEAGTEVYNAIEEALLNHSELTKAEIMALWDF